jgi:hypothetical protein
VKLFGFLQIIFERQGPEKGMFFVAEFKNKKATVFCTCHALVIVFCVFVICLGRPGCDMGLYVVFRIGVCIIWDRG